MLIINKAVFHLIFLGCLCLLVKKTCTVLQKPFVSTYLVEMILIWLFYLVKVNKHKHPNGNTVCFPFYEKIIILIKLNQHYSRLKRRLRLRFVTGTWAFIHALLQYPHAWRLLVAWQHWRSCEGSFPTASAAWEATVDLVASRVWVRPAFQLDNHCHLLNNVIAQLFTGCICLFCLRLPNRWSCFSFNFMLFMYPANLWI